MSNNMVKLGDIASFKTGPFGTQLSAKEYTSSGTPIINVKNIGYGNVIVEGIEYIGEATKNRLSEHLLRKGDIVFGRKGSVDRHAYIDDDCVGWMQGSDCLRVRCIDGVNSRYVSHYLKLDFARKQITNAAVGSTMASLNVDILKGININLPPIEIQDKIERFFTALEDKIVNNNRISVSLLERVSTIYDYWFIQFEFPNEEGKPYKSSGGEMVWCEELKKDIPKGWSYGELKDIANITMGQSPDGSSYNDSGEGMVFYQGKTDFGLRFPTPRMYTTSPTRFAKKGDILLSVRAPVGSLNVAMEDCCIGRGLAALNSKVGSNLHLYYTLLSLQPVFQVYNGNGTTFGSITKDNLYKLIVVVPSDDVVGSFEDYVCSIDKKIVVCEEQNCSLEEQRDWLLPLLMNGQATIK